MLRIAFINMPIASLRFPSLGLTQLRSALLRRFSDQLEISIRYLNHDFATLLDPRVTEWLANRSQPRDTLLGDWLFRQAAFPDAPDNREQFLAEYGRLLSGGRDHQGLERLIDDRPQYERFLDQMIDRYQLDRCDVVGFTLLGTQTTASLGMARKLKQRNPRIITLLGGACCGSPMGQVLARNVEAVDFVFPDAALKSLPQFVEHVLDGDIQRCHAVHGVFSRQNLAQLGRDYSQHMGEHVDINDLLELDYSEYLHSLEQKVPRFDGPLLLFETSRGCQWGSKSQCNFCGYNAKYHAYEPMDSDVALRQLMQFTRYGAESVALYAVDDAIPHEYVTDLCPRLRLPRNITLSYFVRPVLNEQQLRTLARAGVTAIGAGIETMATSTSRRFRKSTNAFQNVAFLKDCTRVRGMLYGWDLMIGAAGEPEAVYEKYLRDLPRMYHLPAPRNVNPVHYYRYSPYFQHQLKFDLKLEPRRCYELIYPFPESEIQDLAYLFDDANAPPDRSKRIEAWRQRLERIVALWRTHWRMPDDDQRPVLEIRDGGDGAAIVHDTRSGEAVSHVLSEPATRLLWELEQPRTAAQLERLGLGVSQAQITEQIGELDDRGLLFEEDGRYLSLGIWPSKTDAAPCHPPDRQAVLADATT